jgi:hypothetical protein
MLFRAKVTEVFLSSLITTDGNAELAMTRMKMNFRILASWYLIELKILCMITFFTSIKYGVRIHDTAKTLYDHILELEVFLYQLNSSMRTLTITS